MLLAGFTLQATVLEDFSFEELSASSELIFEGRVVDQHITSDDAFIYTTVTFAIAELLHGQLSESLLTLRFVGGESDQFQVQVEGQYIPAIGDRGIYFVSSEYAQQLNPLSGWYQGAFLIEEDESGTYLNLDSRPDLILQNAGQNPLVKKLLALKYSEKEIAARYPAYQRFPLSDFKAAIRAASAASSNEGE